MMRAFRESSTLKPVAKSFPHHSSELLPSLQAELKQCREEFERGDYDWPHQALDHRSALVC
jgi:hypothetical protein